MKKNIGLIGCIVTTGMLFVSTATLAANPNNSLNATGYLEMSGGGGLIGNAFDSKYKSESSFGPVANARLGGGVLFNSDTSTRFIGLNGHYNVHGYGDANIALGRHINEKTDYSFMLGADFNSNFIAPRMAMDLVYKPTKHLGLSAELAFDAFIFPSAWLGARYTF